MVWARPGRAVVELVMPRLVYLSDGIYEGQACEGRWIWSIADGELRFERFDFGCA